jgi:hypothetical protein
MSFKKAILLVFGALASSTTVVAWGNSGHATVGLVTQRLLNPNVRAELEQLMNNDKSVKDNFSAASTWADDIKNRPEYRWSSHLHYVGLLGNSSHTCVTYVSDHCDKGQCIITGIGNYTNRLVTERDQTQRQEAFKFLLHFLGDIGQPLHATNVKRGGNDYTCKWGNHTTNLHAVWDFLILDKYIGNNFSRYIEQVESDVTVGKYAYNIEQWLSCFNRAGGSLESCVIAWANEANQFNCNCLFPGYYHTRDQNRSDLSTSYYGENVEYVNMFVSRSAVRAAAYLNMLLEGKAPCFNCAFR